MNKDYNLALTPWPKGLGFQRLDLVDKNLPPRIREDKKANILKSPSLLEDDEYKIGNTWMTPVTFTYEAQSRAKILVRINTLTDKHRHDFSPFLLEEIQESKTYAGRFLLPSDGIFSYNMADVSHLPEDIGLSRQGWLSVHQAGFADPKNPITISNPLGNTSSLWLGPRAGVRPWPLDELEGWLELSHNPGICLFPGNDKVLLVFDGQFWKNLKLAAGLRTFGHGHTIISIGSQIKTREDDLTRPEKTKYLVEKALELASQRLKRPITYADLIAGQSFGGLAVAKLASYFPDLMKYGLVQSGSFWHPYTRDHSYGDLILAIQGGHTKAKNQLIVQVGTEEGRLVNLSKSFTKAYRDQGGHIIYRQYRGGHDYAWWRYGLIDGLDIIDKLEKNLLDRLFY